MNTRLAPGLVWPARPQDVRVALGEVWDRVEVGWLFWKKQPTTTPIAVTWAPLTNVMADQPESHHGLKVWISPVGKGDGETVRRAVEVEVLPDLARWCRAALAAPEGWTLMRHERRWSFTGVAVTATEREGVAALRW